MAFPEPGQNVGLGFVKLKDWALRPGADLKINALVKRAMVKFSQIRNAMVFAFAPPAVIELGRPRGSISSCRTGAGWATKP